MSKIEIAFPELYEAQLEVFKELINPSTKFITVNGSRQIGKTILICQSALYLALNSDKQTIMIVSASDAQVKEIQNRILEMLKPCFKEVVEKSKLQSGDAEIIFKNGSKILYRTANSENTLRGYSLNHILLDEVAFMKEEVWNTILAPSLSSKGKNGKVMFCSTPKGGNFFQKLYLRGINKEKGYKSFKITYHQNPYADLDFIEGQQRELPEAVFQQEYLGEFTDKTGVFKYVEELATLSKIHPNQNFKNCFIGIDVAFKNDYTVAVCIDSEGKMLDYIRFNDTDTTALVEQLHFFIASWNPRKILIENNNQGTPIYQLLKEKQIYGLEDFNTNGKSKSELINQVMSAFSNKEIFLLNDEIIKSEFKAYTYYLTKSGAVQFEAAYGCDDTVIATSLAWMAKVLYGVGRIVFM